MKEELKPCPFCGSLAEIKTVTRHIENNLIVARCSMCGASTKTFNEKAVVMCMSAWNRRVGKAE